LVVSILILFMLIGFSGCSSKNIEPENEVVLNEYDSDDEELDDFEDELEVEEIYDPFSGYNKTVTSFNDNVYKYFAKPVAKGYKFVLHREIRSSIGNFFQNIYFPVRFFNNLLQGKFYNASEETGRFFINTTVGVLGLFDPAKNKFNLEAHKEDFGQTLGYYGVGSGPHIVVPLFGPSNLRDLIALAPDSLLNPVKLVDEKYYFITYLATKSIESINDTSLHINRYDKLKEDAVDLYPYLRDVYEQYRDNQIAE